MEERRSKEKVQTLDVYTDGSLKRGESTLRCGGWAYIIVQDVRPVHYASGGMLNTTNQRMELSAMAEALEYVSKIRKPNQKVVVYSDSAYIINCYLKEWYITWLSNGWVTSKRERVANQDLWERIIPYFDNFWYEFRKVQAHSGNYWNEECDARAQEKADRIKRGLDKE